MQLFAKDCNNRLVSASRASKGIDYFCRECLGPLRLRGGLHMQLHFYHSSKKPKCSQSQKSLYHIQTQQFILNMLGDGTVVLEKQFEQIGRIADVVWESKRLIFEVQCSWISKEEVEQRNSDYKSLGYNVIWILHEMRYNRRRPSGAEVYLRASPHYFTNIDRQGRGWIYDQMEQIKGGLRISYGRRYAVRLDHPRDRSEDWDAKQNLPLPESFRLRLKEWPVYFSGDFLDAWFQGDAPAAAILLDAWEKDAAPSLRTNPFAAYLLLAFEHLFLRPYRLFFNVILERLCK